MTNPHDLTAAERAAAVIDKAKAELPQMWCGGRQRMVLEQVIAEALQQTRCAALEEAITAVQAEMLEDAPDNIGDEAYNTAIQHAVCALKDRLAREGER